MTLASYIKHESWLIILLDKVIKMWDLFRVIGWGIGLVLGEIQVHDEV